MNNEYGEYAVQYGVQDWPPKHPLDLLGGWTPRYVLSRRLVWWSWLSVAYAVAPLKYETVESRMSALQPETSPSWSHDFHPLPTMQLAAESSLLSAEPSCVLVEVQPMPPALGELAENEKMVSPEDGPKYELPDCELGSSQYACRYLAASSAVNQLRKQPPMFAPMFVGWPYSASAPSQPVLRPQMGNR